MRYTLTVAALACVLMAAGCGGATSASTADGLAETPLAGQVVKQTVTDDAKAMDYLSPDAAEVDVIDAAHVIGTPVTFTVFQYKDEAAATAGLAAWRAEVEDGILGESMFAQQASLTGEARDLEGVVDENIVVDVGGIPNVIARKGAFVVRVIGGQSAGIEAITTLAGGM